MTGRFDMPQENRFGFTLIEILLVIFIVGLLSAFSVVALSLLPSLIFITEETNAIRQSETSLR